MKEADVGWVRGALTIKGCFSVNAWPKWFIGINSPRGWALRYIARVVGVGKVTGPYHDGNPKHQPMYYWRVTKLDDGIAALEFLLDGPHVMDQDVLELTYMLYGRRFQLRSKREDSMSWDASRLREEGFRLFLSKYGRRADYAAS